MKGKKYFITIIVSLIIGFLIGFFVKEQSVKKSLRYYEKLIGEQVETEEVIEKQIEVGYGWSIKSDEKLAVNESITKMKQGVKKPEFVVVYATVTYDLNKIKNYLKSKLGNAKLFGITSCVGVVTKDGVHIGPKGSIAIMGMRSDKVDFGVAGRSFTEKENIKNVAKKVIKQAIKDAGRSITETPSIVLIGASPGFEEDLIAGIEEVIGKDVPIYGGSAADNTIEGKWAIFVDNKIIRGNGIALAVIYTPLKVGYAFDSGYRGTAKYGTVTKAEGRLIQEIDNRPAGKVYCEWAGKDKFADALRQGKIILAESSFTPLAYKLEVEGKTRFVSLHPHKFWPKKNNSLSVFAKPKVGDTLYLIEGNPKILAVRPQSVLVSALVKSKISQQEMACGLLIYCAGTMLAIKDGVEYKGKVYKIDQIVENINKISGDMPYIGAFTFGEQGLIEGYGNYHGNLMNSMVVFSHR